MMLSIKNIFKKKDAKPEGSIDFLKRKAKRAQDRKLRDQERKRKIMEHLERAGLKIDLKKLFKTFFNIAIIINLAVSAYLIYYFSTSLGIKWSAVATAMFVLWVLVFIILIFALWGIFYIAVDLKIFRRKVDLEEVLPDFLQLTASNINAGMTIDRALWFAVRPRFGVLAKEIEMVAKETMSGVDLKTALEKFSTRYDSVILKRAISMVNESVEAGGRIGDLLNRVAVNVQEQKAMVNEMSANVTTYVIFITFAAIVAAPVLFGLSGVLIGVVQNLGSTLGATSSAVAGAGMSLTFSGTGVTQSDFRIFAITSLVITSFFSAVMVSTIKSGNFKSGVKYVPIFLLVSLTIYFIVNKIGDSLIGLFL